MAEALTCFYESEIAWMGDKKLRLTGAHLPAGVGGAPAHSMGRENNESPERAFVASLNTWYILTLLAIAKFSKIQLLSVSSRAKGKLTKNADGNYQVTEMIVKPRIVLASANDLERLSRILEKAKENCFISDSIKRVIKIEPEVYHRQIPAFPCPLGEDPPDLSEITAHASN